MKLAATLLILNCLMSAAVHIVPPDWSGATGPYVQIVTPVKVLVDQFGAVVLIESAEPLPDNVVSSLEQSRFFDRKYLGKGLQLNVPVRRYVSQGRERLLVPEWVVPDNSEQLWDAERYSEQQAALLESKAEQSHDPRDRALLLGYYSFSASVPAEVAKHKRHELIRWLVQNDPDSDTLGTAYALINTRQERLAAQRREREVLMSFSGISKAPSGSAQVHLSISARRLLFGC